MRKRDWWIKRVRAIELEYRVAVLAVAELRDRLRTDPGLLPADLKMTDVRRTAAELGATYFVRLYAVFEAGLREAWRVALGRTTQPPMRDLLDGLASSCDIQHPVLAAAHHVREYRNSLVHEQDDPPEVSFTIGDGRRHLTRFFSYLPPEW